MSKWISPKDALPELLPIESKNERATIFESQPVLVWQKEPVKDGLYVNIARLARADFIGENPFWIDELALREIKVAAWMPLPKRPEFEEAVRQIPGQIVMQLSKKPSVRSLRMKAGFTQENLADMAGLHKKTIHKLETGYAVRRSTLRLICEALGVEIDDVEEADRCL